MKYLFQVSPPPSTQDFFAVLRGKRHVEFAFPRAMIRLIYSSRDGGSFSMRNTMDSEDDISRNQSMKGPWLELTPSRRARRTYLALSGLLLSSPLALFAIGWNEDSIQTALLLSLLLLFGLSAVQATTQRIRFFDSYIETRFFGFWLRRRLVERLEFEEITDDKNPYAGIAKAVFKTPNDIVARSAERRRIWLRIPGALLSNLTEDQYKQVLDRLIERYDRTA